MAQFIGNQIDDGDNLAFTLKSPKLSEEQRIAIIIKHLNQNRYYLFFDSVHLIEKNSNIESFFSILKQKLTQSIIFISSRANPAYVNQLMKQKKF
ncbi:MAG: hypothetical protein HC903_31255 [Methylacidiphilales bacterium]|nr:hypothetical protein [Candidatus Methylacidiphilales bacterium]